MSVLVGPVADVASALDVLCALDAASLADAESVMALQEQAERLQAVACRAAAAFEAGDAWRASGAKSAAAWLAGRCHLPVAMARRRIRLGRVVRQLPLVEAAWSAGEIGEAHVALCGRARTARTAEALARDEAMLVREATRLRFDDFSRHLAYWLQRNDPDGAEDSARRQHDQRRVHLSQSFQGVWFLDGVLDPIGGTILDDVLTAIERELFHADRADAKQQRGHDDIRPADLARTPAQRRADALVELARRAAAMPAGARKPEPLFTVHVGYETFAGPLCQLANNTVITPGSLVPWLDQAWIERVVFDGPSRIIDLGAHRRLFTGATRRAVELLDEECFHDLCDTPAAACEIDHIQPWAAGRPTTIDNGRCACRFHNLARHRRAPEPPADTPPSPEPP